MPVRGRLPAGEESEQVIGTLEPPPTLSQRAAEIFRDIAAKCERESYALSPMDAPMLALYATAVADAMEHADAIEKEGWVMKAPTSGYTYPNPRVAMRDAALKRAVGAATKLGLAKLDRRRLPKSTKAVADAYAKFVK